MFYMLFCISSENILDNSSISEKKYAEEALQFVKKP